MKKLVIGQVGFGTVGKGIYKVIKNAKNAHAEIKHICVANLDKDRGEEFAEALPLLTDNIEDIFNDEEINLIVEVIDDANVSYDIVTRALKKGIPVVSGNKIMIANNLPELIELQKEHDASLL